MPASEGLPWPTPCQRAKKSGGHQIAHRVGSAFAARSQGMQGVRVEGTSDIRELKVLGDWAWLRNYLEITVTPPAAPPVRRAGYTLTILQKQADGRWLLARDANLMAAGQV